MADVEVGEGLVLREGAEGITLVGRGMELRGDFTRLLPRLRADRLSKELLVRAARIRVAEGPLTAVDATAGLGEDALLLAAAGFQVTLYERDRVIAALLRDALERAMLDERLAEPVSRMQLIEADSIEALRELAVSPDVIYLDPMFPAKRKDAATRKKLQFLQLLEQQSADEAELLAAALAARPRKVVVKRPLKGPQLAGSKPSSTFAGKVVRYDVYVPA